MTSTPPEFHIVGAPRSGGLTLSTWLTAHPEIDFLRRDQTGGSTPAHKARSRAGKESQPSPVQPVTIGRLDEWALYSDDRISALRTSAPDARFIICLSNPAELAWGLHSQNLRAGVETVRDFHTAWNLCSARRNGRGSPPGQSAECLDYATIASLGQHVTRLLTQIPRSQIHFVYLEDMLNHPEQAWAQVCDFLEISEAPLGKAPIKENVIKAPAPPLHDILLMLRDWKRRLLPNFRTGLTAGLRINGVWPGRDCIKPLPRSVRQSVCDTLADDIAILSVLTDRDLSSWVA